MPTQAEIDAGTEVQISLNGLNGRTRESIAGDIALVLEAAEHVRWQPIETAKPLSEWHEDIGPVLWWKFPINEPPYIGSPLDIGRAVEVTIRDSVRDYKYTENVGGWPGYHTHWTPLPSLPSPPETK